MKSEQWAFRAVKGPKADVIAAVNASPAPPQAKAYLAWLIESSPHAGLTLDCHAHSAGDNFAEHTTLKKLY
jgi:hypothetical protein